MVAMIDKMTTARAVVTRARCLTHQPFEEAGMLTDNCRADCLAVERWQDLPGFPGYQVSDHGRCRSASKILQPCKSFQGYLKFRLARNGHVVNLSAHRAVLLAFVGEPPTPKHECCHFDGSKDNNHLSNLRWGTREENCADKLRHGTMPLGERCLTSRLTLDDVREIRRLCAKGFVARKVAALFDVAPGTVKDILQGRRWRHLQ